MEYICVDRGGERCPCILMEAGQCYMCNMIRSGKCSCASLWQGVCPYTEYLQRNKKVTKEVVPKNLKIAHIKSYSPTLSVITLESTLAFGLKCEEMGAFLMVQWKDWFIPISVLRVTADFENQLSYIDLAVNASGPKTIGLLKKAIIGEKVVVKGPFYSGLINKESFDKTANTIILAKGIAATPLANMKKYLIGSENTLNNTKNKLMEFKLDRSKLPNDFITEYLSDFDFEDVDLESESFEIAESMKEAYGYSYVGEKRPNLLLMVSPYYVEKILKLTGLNRNRMITPNHSNMCCGEGYCGSCSYTDKDGITVRMCKCRGGIYG